MRANLPASPALLFTAMTTDTPPPSSVPTVPTVLSASSPAADTPPDQAALVLRQFRVVFNAVRTHFQQVEKKVGIGGAQVWALSVIRRTPGAGVNSLAQAMNIHQSTASNLVRQLARRGLVRVDKSSVDRRSVHLHLEAAGEALLLASPGPYAGVLPDALQKLPADTLVQLQRNLGEVIRALAADESAAGIPLADL